MWFSLSFPQVAYYKKNYSGKLRREGGIGAERLESMLWGWGTRRKPIKDFIWAEQAKGLVWVLTLHLQTQRASKTIF